MKTLHLYLTRQVLATLLMTVAVFTFVLLLGNALKEILALLVSRQATLWGVGHAFALLIPWVLVFALPMGMLTAALLVFGRFSADQELTAARAGGLSLVSLVTPVLLLSVMLCGLSAWLNMEVAPRCRVAYKHLLGQMGVKLAVAMLPEGRYTIVTDETSTNLIYVGRVEGNELHEIMVRRVDAAQGEIILDAMRGSIVYSNDVASLHLYDVRDFQKSGQGWSLGTAADFPYQINLGRKDQAADERPSVTDMTYSQLAEELRELENRFSLPTSDLTVDGLAKLKGELEAQQMDMTMPLRVQMHRQIAFSFACFGFTLVGIPLGIRAHRRETNAGIAMALLLVLVYYSFIILGQSLQTHADWAPDLIIWAPNFIFQAVGAVMLWRANRGG